MPSTVLEVLGLTCFVVMAGLLGGAPAALGVAGVCLLFTGAVADDSAMSKALRSGALISVRLVRAVRTRMALERRIEDALAERRVVK